ncbi:hypothetical protein N9A04_00830, partial [Rickettsiales bacterium]|nr:hypothetical protein [Rickettsiales bacterium]
MYYLIFILRFFIALKNKIRPSIPYALLLSLLAFGFSGCSSSSYVSSSACSSYSDGNRPLWCYRTMCNNGSDMPDWCSVNVNTPSQNAIDHVSKMQSFINAVGSGSSSSNPNFSDNGLAFEAALEHNVESNGISIKNIAIDFIGGNVSHVKGAIGGDSGAAQGTHLKRYAYDPSLSSNGYVEQKGDNKPSHPAPTTRSITLNDQDDSPKGANACYVDRSGLDYVARILGYSFGDQNFKTNVMGAGNSHAKISSYNAMGSFYRADDFLDPKDSSFVNYGRYMSYSGMPYLTDTVSTANFFGFTDRMSGAIGANTSHIKILGFQGLRDGYQLANFFNSLRPIDEVSVYNMTSYDIHPFSVHTSGLYKDDLGKIYVRNGDGLTPYNGDVKDLMVDSSTQHLYSSCPTTHACAQYVGNERDLYIDSSDNSLHRGQIFLHNAYADIRTGVVHKDQMQGDIEINILQAYYDPTDGNKMYYSKDLCPSSSCVAYTSPEHIVDLWHKGNEVYKAYEFNPYKVDVNLDGSLSISSSAHQQPIDLSNLVYDRSTSNVYIDGSKCPSGHECFPYSLTSWNINLDSLNHIQALDYGANSFDFERYAFDGNANRYHGQYVDPSIYDGIYNDPTFAVALEVPFNDRVQHLYGDVSGIYAQQCSGCIDYNPQKYSEIYINTDFSSLSGPISSGVKAYYSQSLCEANEPSGTCAPIPINHLSASGDGSAEGVLYFDGSNKQIYFMPNRSVTEVFQDSSGTIYWDHKSCGHSCNRVDDIRGIYFDSKRNHFVNSPKVCDSAMNCEAIDTKRVFGDGVNEIAEFSVNNKQSGSSYFSTQDIEKIVFTIDKKLTDDAESIIIAPAGFSSINDTGGSYHSFYRNYIAEQASADASHQNWYKEPVWMKSENIFQTNGAIKPEVYSSIEYERTDKSMVERPVYYFGNDNGPSMHTVWTPSTQSASNLGQNSAKAGSGSAISKQSIITDQNFTVNSLPNISDKVPLNIGLTGNYPSAFLPYLWVSNRLTANEVRKFGMNISMVWDDGYLSNSYSIDGGTTNISASALFGKISDYVSSPAYRYLIAGAFSSGAGEDGLGTLYPYTNAAGSLKYNYVTVELNDRQNHLNVTSADGSMIGDSHQSTAKSDASNNLNNYTGYKTNTSRKDGMSYSEYSASPTIEAAAILGGYIERLKSVFFGESAKSIAFAIRHTADPIYGRNYDLNVDGKIEHIKQATYYFTDQFATSMNTAGLDVEQRSLMNLLAKANRDIFVFTGVDPSREYDGMYDQMFGPGGTGFSSLTAGMIAPHLYGGSSDDLTDNQSFFSGLGDMTYTRLDADKYENGVLKMDQSSNALYKDTCPSGVICLNYHVSNSTRLYFDAKDGKVYGSYDDHGNVVPGCPDKDSCKLYEGNLGDVFVDKITKELLVDHNGVVEIGVGGTVHDRYFANYKPIDGGDNPKDGDTEQVLLDPNTQIDGSVGQGKANSFLAIDLSTKSYVKFAWEPTSSQYYGFGFIGCGSGVECNQGSYETYLKRYYAEHGITDERQMKMINLSVDSSGVSSCKDGDSCSYSYTEGGYDKIHLSIFNEHRNVLMLAKVDSNGHYQFADHKVQMEVVGLDPAYQKSYIKADGSLTMDASNGVGVYSGEMLYVRSSSDSIYLRNDGQLASINACATGEMDCYKYSGPDVSTHACVPGETSCFQYANQDMYFRDKDSISTVPCVNGENCSHYATLYSGFFHDVNQFIDGAQDAKLHEMNIEAIKEAKISEGCLSDPNTCSHQDL